MDTDWSLKCIDEDCSVRGNIHMGGIFTNEKNEAD